MPLPPGSSLEKENDKYGSRLLTQKIKVRGRKYIYNIGKCHFSQDHRWKRRMTNDKYGSRLLRRTMGGTRKYGSKCKCGKRRMTREMHLKKDLGWSNLLKSAKDQPAVFFVRGVIAEEESNKNNNTDEHHNPEPEHYYHQRHPQNDFHC